MVVSRWRERLNGNFWGCVSYYLRRNSNRTVSLFWAKPTVAVEKKALLATRNLYRKEGLESRHVIFLLLLFSLAFLREDFVEEQNKHDHAPLLQFSVQLIQRNKFRFPPSYYSRASF